MSDSGWADNAIEVVREIEKNIKTDSGTIIGITIFAKFKEGNEEEETIDAYLASHEFPQDIELWKTLRDSLINAVNIMATRLANEPPESKGMLH